MNESGHRLETRKLGHASHAPGLLFRLFVLWLVLLGACAGCDKPKPRPDGSSGVRGVALAPTEPPDENGDVPPREPWTKLRVHALLVNSSDADYKTQIRTFVDDQGRFEIALNPGEYLIGVHDPERLAGKMSTPMMVKVEPGKFAEIVVDYDKLNVRDVPGAR